MTTACVMMNQAVENELLTIEQVKQLGTLTGQSLKKDYQSVVSNFQFSEKKLANAFADLNCSQFIVRLNEAK